MCLERLTDLVQLPDLDLDGLAGEGGAVAGLELGEGGQEGLLGGEGGVAQEEGVEEQLLRRRTLLRLLGQTPAEAQGRGDG